jgi:Holliday junction DNA helicase RuvA
MISTLRGTVESIYDDSAVISVGGIGFLVYLPTSVLSNLGGAGTHARLFTQMVVREDSIQLFGFATAEDLKLFQLLTGVSGIGPRLALALLSSMEAGDLVSAIASGSVDLLTTVPGVGKKLAGRLVLELKDKIAEAASIQMATVGEADNDVISALLSLGYSAAEASRAVASIPRGQNLAIEDKLKFALSYFGKH